MTETKIKEVRAERRIKYEKQNWLKRYRLFRLRFSVDIKYWNPNEADLS